MDVAVPAAREEGFFVGGEGEDADGGGVRAEGGDDLAFVVTDGLEVYAAALEGLVKGKLGGGGGGGYLEAGEEPEGLGVHGEGVHGGELQVVGGLGDVEVLGFDCCC